MPETHLGRLAVGSDRAVTFFFGLAMATGLAPFSLGPVAFGAVIAVVWLASKAPNAKRMALLGWLAGVGYFGLGLHWIVEPFFVDAAVTGWMAPFALIGLAGGLALFWAAAFGLAARLGGGVWRLAILWAAFEIARGFVFTGFPWALVGHIWSGTQVLQWGAYIGPYGLTLVTLLLAALPLWAWGQLRNPAVALALAFGGWATLLGVGLWQSQSAAEIAQDAPVVRLVQPNAPQDEKWDPDKIPIFFNRMVSYSQEGPRPDVILWPESALPVLLEDADATLEYIAERAQTTLVIGLQRRGEDNGAYHNSLAVIDETGQVRALYDKHHLVPFGEYMPFPAFWRALGIAALAERTEFGYAPGPGSGPAMLDLPGLGKALALICYEAIFPRHTRIAGQRPDFLMQLTNDAWFGAAVGPWQHLEQARMRAIEQGVPMVRVANTGVSAVLDGKGALVDSLPLNAAGYIDVPLPPALAPTLYARMGDVPVFVFLGLLLIWVAVRKSALTPSTKRRTDA
ncbi:apolipoprotein N-acyltransferase [Roseobacteraceae bacterium S113]